MTKGRHYSRNRADFCGIFVKRERIKKEISTILKFSNSRLQNDNLFPRNPPLKSESVSILAVE
jgi:hypothetical protein